MPSSFSANLLLELMADGENEGLWGDITNENLEILGRAAGGMGNITLAGTTHTLTVAQGALSEGQYSVLVLGGAPTGTNTITIQPNTVTRTYLVKNSSGEDAIFTQGSGGNVTVPDGGTAIIFCNGVGASSAVTDIAADFLRGVNNLSEIDDAPTALQNLGLTATAAELNTLDGITASTAELNKLDGFTGVSADLNYAKDLRATGVTTTEFDKLDGLTATTAELNKLDGFTGVAADLNYAKDLRATGVTTTEFDKLDGLTASTADLNTASTHYVPQGGIIMWSGSIANIPSGWALCNGANDTPDLRNRFVVGAGSSYSVNATGGADSVSLSTSQIPSHNHTFSGTTSTRSLTGQVEFANNGATDFQTTGVFSESGTSTQAGFGSGTVSKFLDLDVSHNHTFSGTTSSTGSGGSHENRPPYYALAYIMKL